MRKKVKKRFFAVLLLLTIVFSNVGMDFFYVQASSIEANESVQEESTETVTDTVTVETGTETIADTEEVTENTETVEDTEEVAEDTEHVENTEVIGTEEVPQEESTEEGDTQEAPVQEFNWRETTAERNLYYDDWSKDNMGRIYLGETLEELFQMYDDPSIEMADWEDFFAGTCFAGATLDDLKWMQENGYTMEQLVQIASDNNRSSVWQMLSGIALMDSYKDKTVSFGGTTKTGHIPVLGKKNAPLYTMSMGGKKAFCADCGKHMSSSTVLSYVSEVTTSYIKKAAAYADSGGYYPFSQFYIWAGGNKENYCKGYAQFYYSMMHQDLSYDQIAALTTSNSSYASLYKEAEKSYDSISNTNASGVHVYMYSNGNSSYQRIYAMFRDKETTTPDPPPDPTPSNDPLYADVSADAEAYVDANVSLNVVKKDNVTGQGLAGAVFNFFKDGGFEGSGTTDSNGNVSFSFTTSYYGASSSSKTYCTNYGSLTDDKKATVSTYTSYDAAYNAAYNEAYTKALNAANAAKNSTSHNYSATEVTARNGYYLNPGNTTVGQSAAGDASLNLSLANVRTTGSITITKEDSETGAIAQGDATLSGAVYGLYARSNIVHPDGHTGILYTAGSLVATFPPTDANRQARLDNLYLGNYYVKEITPSTGYLLDTKEYDVAVTYEGQDVPNVVRTSTVTEDVIKGNIRLVKHLQEKDPSAASRPQVPEVGAEFDIILKSSGVTYAHIVTDADGFAQANMLPYGNYIVRQTKGKEGYSCINGYYDANGIEEFKVIQREEKLEEEKKNLNIKLIGVAGACNRIGTTTHAMQIIRYLQLKGYKACYIQMNSTKYVSNMLEWFNIEDQDNEIGRITYSGIDHFYNVNKIQDVLRLGYDYYVYDYGVNCDVNFNRVSFMEKDIKIFVVGADPTEIPYTYDIVKSAFYDDVKYIFNFAAKTDADDLKDLMGDKFDCSFIAEFIPDKYVYAPTDIYEKIVPVTDLSVDQGKTKKRKGFFGKKKK